MKKKLLRHFPWWERTKQLIRIMKLTLMISVCFVLSVAGNSYSQTTKLDLKLKGSTIKEVLSQIEDESEFIFLYKIEELNENKKIDIDLKDASIKQILDEILKDQNLTYDIYNRQIIIRKSATGDNVTPFPANQSIKVSGKVTDSSGAPLPGVTVVVKGTTQGIITDVDGNYTLVKVPGDATLVFSFVGMKTQEEAVAGKSLINVMMKEDAIGLEEVIAIGYGTQKKETVTGSVVAVKGETLAKANVANVTNSMAGQLPGLISLNSNGMPGKDAATLSIRGFGSALVIVDGIEADISTLDANAIESISILKDGAASIYGARAGNGVILVTTKRGQTGKPKINFTSSFTLQGLTRFPGKASSGQYAEMMSEAAINSGTTVPYTPEQIQNYYDEIDPYLYPNTDWEDVLLRTWAPQQQHNLSVRGGSDKIKYYGFIGYLNQETVFKNHGGDFSRIHVQSNIDAQITERLSAQFDFSSINSISRMPQQDLFGNSSAGGTVWDHYWADLPIYPAELPDPTKYSYNGSNGQTQILSNREIFGHNDYIGNDLKATLSLKYKFSFVKGLSAKAFVNARQIYGENEYFQKPAYFYTYDPITDTYTLIGGFTEKAVMSQSRSTDRIFTGQFSFDYDRTINEDHHVSGLLLYEAIDYSGNNLSAGRTDFLTPAIEQLFAGSTEGMTNNGSKYEMGRKSIITRVNYKYKNKYLFESILRADASAKFPKESRWGYFPSVSLGWIMSEEDFMKDFKSLEYLKLRASYGQSGNDAVGNFDYLSGYEYGLTNVFSSTEQGIVSTGMANPLLTWEEIAISNLGVDMSFWNRKMYIETDAFYRTRSGIIATRLATLPSTFGADLPPENLNSLNDRGFELKIGTSNRISDFHYDVSVNISWSRAKWDHYEEPVYEDADQNRIYKMSGKWTDRSFGYVSEGLFTSQQQIDELTYDQDGQGNITLRPGDICYKDVNNDGIINWTDQVKIGNGNMPHWMFGFNFNLAYKNFDLSGLFQGAAGYHTWVNLMAYSEENYDNRWTEENNDPNAIVPRLGGSSTNSWTTDHFYKTAAYLRLKSVNLGYNLPHHWLNKAGLERFRIYFAGTNLLTLDKLSKYAMDPEAPSGFSGLYYPQQRTMSIGINLTF